MTHRQVRDVMTTPVVTIPETAEFADIVAILNAHEISAVPVVDAASKIVDIVSATDLLYKEEYHGAAIGRSRVGSPRYKAAGTVARDVMTPAPITTGPDVSLAEAARLLDACDIKRLPVVDASGHLVGIVAPRDLLRVFLRPDDEIRQEVTDTVLRQYLQANPALVTVEVHNGVVTLGGELPLRSQIPLAGLMASAIDGVVEVHTHLTAAVDDHLLPRTVDVTDY